MLKDKNILLGVTGGIAAYKSPAICSILRKQGANVKVVMTESATKFVTALTFQTMSNNEVHVKMFDERVNMNVEHIALAKWADIIVVAPATANTIAKYANGICDNLLTTILLASRSKVMFVPAMNTFMLNSRSNIENMETLKRRGVEFLGTRKDLLACNDYGDGKMLEPSEIVEEIDDALTEKDLFNRKFLITAGPTIEEIDPVRYITNHSSGKMGYALAKEAKKRGAEVRLISGPTSIKKPKVNEFIKTTSAQSMYKAVDENFDWADVLIKVAAVADFSPVEYKEDKIKKTEENSLDKIELKRNVDILKHFASKKSNKIVVGFAAESKDEINYGLKKLISKNLDLIVVNNIKKQNAGFKTDTNTASIIDKNKKIESLDSMSKTDLANIILNRVKELF